MKGGSFFRLTRRDLIKLPYGSELFMLPERVPVGYDSHRNEFATLNNCFAVAAFISPGYTVTHNSAYKEKPKSRILPLFSYAAAAYYKGAYYAASVLIDKEKRQDLRLMDLGLLRQNIKKIRKVFPRNRLVRHLENCALCYACPAAKNFFLARYEAPLPASPSCNAYCIGCISYQKNKNIPVTQPRIKFIPTPQEIAEVALFHINRVKDPVVSFGQGCEGEPLLAGSVIEQAIRLIRRETKRGIININTNASRPEIVARLFDAGLDSIRVSMNSVRKPYYAGYYKPKGYSFFDVLDSIKIAKKKKGFVSINYLTMPGFTDLKDEFLALKKFVGNYKIDMIQWRNLNFDPVRYFKVLGISPEPARMLGIEHIIKSLKNDFPSLMMGYFNPSRLRIKRHLDTRRGYKSS